MESLRILLAEDESISLMGLKAKLESLGHQVVAEGATGSEAVALARETKPDLAILDIKMPDMDGIEASRKIMEEEPIPIILLTGYGQEGLAQRAVEAGVFGYLLKPAGEEDLVPAITLARARFKEFRALQAEVENLREALETRRLVERAKGILMRRLNLGEEEAFRRLQQRSQDENRKMGEIAQAIITADEMFEKRI
ncbi:MAG: ANTAR domain-containing response regulator [Anaerolineae bacterium]